MLEYAWEVIVDFATELLEKEQADELPEISDQKKTQSLAQKRSFFVRMVSDPKIYNPAINKSGTPRISTEVMSPIHDSALVTVESPPQ